MKKQNTTYVNRIKLKRRISGLMAAVLLITGIGTATYLQSRSVYAKDTLESINKLVGSIKNDKPYNILEIVPDKVSFNKAIYNYANVSVNIIGNQTMSFMGYYVGGYEPIIKYDIPELYNDNLQTDKYVYSSLNDSNLRYNMFDALMEPLSTKDKGIAYDEKGSYDIDKKPIYIKDSDKYFEIREGEIFDDYNRPFTEAEFSYYFKNNSYKELKRDYYGDAAHSDGIAYVDIANGQMFDVGIKKGNYARSYYLGAGTENNVAYDFLNKYLSYNAIFIDGDNEEISKRLKDETDGSSILYVTEDEDNSKMIGFANDDFCYLSFNEVYNDEYDEYDELEILDGEDRTNGMFDPNLRYIHIIDNDDEQGFGNDESTVSANVYAEFRYDSGLICGYLPEVVEEFDTTTDEGLNKLKEYRDEYGDGNLPLYVKNENGIYSYISSIDEIIGKDKENSNPEEPNDPENQEEPENPNGPENPSETDNPTEPTNPEENTTSGNEITDPGSNTIIRSEDVFNLSAYSSKDNVINISILEEIDNNLIVDANTEAVSDEESLITDKNEDIQHYEQKNAGDESDSSDNDENNEEDETNNSSNNDESSVIGGLFYILNFHYVQDTDTLTSEKKKFYGVDNFRYAEQGTGAQYVLDTESDKGIIVPNLTGHGVIIVSKDCPDDYFIYDYLYGEGNYNFDGAGRSTTPEDNYKSYHIRGAKIYYRAGITNNEWFKRHILDREVAECADVPITINTKKASEVKSEHIAAADLVVVMSTDTSYCIGDYCKGYTFADNDISYNTLDNLLYRLNKYQLPIVGDYRIVTDHQKKLSQNSLLKEPAVSNFIKALELSSDDFTSYYLGLHTFGSANYKTAPFPAEKTGKLNRKNDDNYVNKNIYLYNRKASDSNEDGFVCFLNDKMMESFGNDNEGFVEVLTDINNENTFREAEGLRKLDINISQATAVRYIIGFNLKREKPKVKDTVRVLEIEPCASYDLTVGIGTANTSGRFEGTALSVNRISTNSQETLYKQKDTKIILTRMTTSEFIGRIEDINVEYDLIYIGMNTGMMNTRAAVSDDLYSKVEPFTANYIGETIVDYNSDDMDGIIYTNMGDEIVVNRTLGGMLPNEYYGGVVKAGDLKDENFKTRYSGNDITQEKAEALKDFVSAGYPVILADEFYSRSYSGYYNNRKDQRGEGTGFQYTNNINICRVDQASYMYSFVNDSDVKSRSNFMRIGKVNSDTLDSYINLSKPKLTLYDKTFDSVSTPQKPLRDTAEGKIKLPIYFMIENDGAVSATSKYEVNLLIDLNADGKYSMTREEVDFDIIQSHNSGENIYKTQNVTPDVTPKGTYIVESNVRYDAECWLSDKFIGVVPWRLVVRQYYDENADDSSVGSNERELKRKSAGARRANATGYYEASGTSKPTVKVLQIDTVTLEPIDPTRYGNYPSHWNMQQDYNNHGLLYEYLNNPIVPYNIEIETMTSTEFSSKSAEFRRMCSERGITDVANMNTRNRSQMELYLDSIWAVRSRTDESTKPERWKKAEKEYLDFIYDNKYDMIIMGFADCYVAPNSIAVTAIKDYINAGHSVLLTHDCTSSINTLVDENGNSGRTSVVYGPRAIWGYEYNTLLRSIIGMDRYNVLGEAVTEGNRFVKDVPYIPGYPKWWDNNKATTQIHGFTSCLINRELAWNSQKKNVKTKSNGSIAGTIRYNNMTVQKVNNGQITEYPYKLPDNFSVASTHGQYYQLDYTIDDDKDGESDIVVWYCLDGGNPKDSGKENQFRLTPNDVRNNYYIYNKGNITYTGVGHSMYTDDNPYETQLFVNTMVAAYKAGLQPPQVTFKSSYDGKRNTGNIYISYDETIDLMRSADTEQGGILDTYKDVYFMPEQVSLVQNGIDHKLSAKLYYKVPAGIAGITVEEIPSVEVKELKYDPDSNKSLISGMWYYDKENDTTVDCSSEEGGITRALENLKSGYVYKIRFNLTKMGKFMGAGTDVIDSSSLFVVMTDSMHNQFTGAEGTSTATAEAKFIRTEIFLLD